MTFAIRNTGRALMAAVLLAAGFPKAITASQTLSELFAERRAAPVPQP